MVALPSEENWGWLEGVEEFDWTQSGSDEGEKDGAHTKWEQKREVGRAWWVAFLAVKNRWTRTVGNGLEGYFITLR